MGRHGTGKINIVISYGPPLTSDHYMLAVVTTVITNTTAYLILYVLPFNITIT